MGYWNYRVVRYRNGGGYGLHEVYYNTADEPCAMTESPCRFSSEEFDDLVGSIEQALADVKKRPVFDEPEKWAGWDDAEA